VSYGRIYLIRCLFNGKLYVGQTTQTLISRWRSHKYKGCRALNSAIKLYGPEAFEISILEEVEDREQLDIRESYWITELNTLAPKGYNLKTGGSRGKPSEDTRKRQAFAHKGRKLPESVRKRMSESQQERRRQEALVGAGPTFSDESKHKMRIAKLGSKQSELTRKKRSARMTGRVLPTEVKEKISKSHIGLKPSAETRQKLRQIHLGQKHSPETRKKMSESHKLRYAQDASTRSLVLASFLSKITKSLGVGEHVYVVGGAVRNFLLKVPIKDLDIIIDSVSLGEGRNSEWLAEKIVSQIPVRVNLTTNQYGVAILTVSEFWTLDGFEMKGETIEIANARKESYGGAEGKGYKPHMVEPSTIEEDILRRDFTSNTLLWRLTDLEHGPEKAEVLDLTGLGRGHLEEGLLSTPVDPDKTFGDDPTRMLRSVKFVAKYGFRIDPKVESSIQRNAAKLKQMPWDAVRKILAFDILDGPAPRQSLTLIQNLGLAKVLGEMLADEQGFAAALGRHLIDADAHLILDLLDLGWTMRSPLSFLDREGQLRLREVLSEHPGDEEFEYRYLSGLRKPLVDQEALFTKFSIPVKERGVVAQVARGILLREPTLIEQPTAFLVEVETELSVKYPANEVQS